MTKGVGVGMGDADWLPPRPSPAIEIAEEGARVGALDSSGDLVVIQFARQFFGQTQDGYVVCGSRNDLAAIPYDGVLLPLGEIDRQFMFAERASHFHDDTGFF